MDAGELNRRCVSLIQEPDVLLRMWHAPMFWDVGTLDDPRPEELSRPKFDLYELEVVLATAALQPSQCAAEVNAREPGRADFIMRQVRRGERPLLRRAR